MSKSKKNPNSNSNPNCFSTILRRLICTGDLPTYSDHDHRQINQTDSSDVKITAKKTPLVQIQDESVLHMKPGIVARLMGLDSMPENNICTPTESPFFRSKSLNSLYFFPDFNSNKASHSASHHRSASFSHLGSAFSIKIDEEIKPSRLQSHETRGGLKQSVKKQGKRQKVVETNLKGTERIKNRGTQKYEEGYATKTSSSVNKNNVGCRRGSNLIRDQKHALLVKKQGKLRGGRGVNDAGLIVSSKRRVHHDDDKEGDLNNHVDNEVSSDSLSRSPVSVLDHHLLHLQLDYSPSKEDEREKTSSTRRKPTAKNQTKIYNGMKQECIVPTVPKKHGDEVSSTIEGRKLDNDNQKSKKTDDQKEAEISDYFLGLMGQICRLTEEYVNDSKWAAKSLGFNVHFEEELSLDFGGQILDLLLNELMDELVM